MKKIILGMMLIVGSLSFASQEDRGLQGAELNIQSMNCKVKYVAMENLSAERLIFALESNQRY